MSAWMQVLGWTLIHFVWQGAVADQIVMSQPSRAGADTSNEDYSPYRISPRRE